VTRTRRIGLRLFAVLLAAAALQPRGAASEPPTPALVLERFLALEQTPLTQYRALRRFEARNDKFNSTAWMNVWTEADSSGFHYAVVGEGGSDYIRARVFRGTLQTEQRSWAAHAPERAAVSAANYTFAGSVIEADGLVRVTIKPRRMDLLLVDGSIVLHPETAELLCIEGQLSRAPSFWTRGVHVVRRYDRIAGVHVPVALETSSHVLIAGRSTFTMRWEYGSVNGNPVGPDATAARSLRPFDALLNPQHRY
jgi:hypothetical protein